MSLLVVEALIFSSEPIAPSATPLPSRNLLDSLMAGTRRTPGLNLPNCGVLSSQLLVHAQTGELGYLVDAVGIRPNADQETATLAVALRHTGHELKLLLASTTLIITSFLGLDNNQLLLKDEITYRYCDGTDEFCVHDLSVAVPA